MTKETACKERFDVVYEGGGVLIGYHFCREWDGGVLGCYTNPDHGYSWQDAKKQVIQHLESQIEHWKMLTFDEWKLP